MLILKLRLAIHISVYFVKIPGIADIQNDAAQQATGFIPASSVEFTQISITENASNKQTNKMTSAALLRERNGASIDVSSSFDFRHESTVATVTMDWLRRKNISKVMRTYIIVRLESKNSRSMPMFAIKMFSECSEMSFSKLPFFFFVEKCWLKNRKSN